MPCNWPKKETAHPTRRDFRRAACSLHPFVLTKQVHGKKPSDIDLLIKNKAQTISKHLRGGHIYSPVQYILCNDELFAENELPPIRMPNKRKERDFFFKNRSVVKEVSIGLECESKYRSNSKTVAYFYNSKKYVNPSKNADAHIAMLGHLALHIPRSALTNDGNRPSYYYLDQKSDGVEIRTEAFLFAFFFKFPDFLIKTDLEAYEEAMRFIFMSDVLSQDTVKSRLRSLDVDVHEPRYEPYQPYGLAI